MFKGKVVRSPVLVAMAGLLTLMQSAPSQAGPLTQVAYYPAPGTGFIGGLLIDWQSSTRVRLVNDRGAQSGTATRSGPPSQVQTVVTLDAPLSTLVPSSEPDSCGDFPTLREDTRQVVVRDTAGGLLGGSSQVIEIGTRTPTEGCDAGVSLPFGTPSDEGSAMKRIAMVARPLALDLLPGTRLAGLSEQPWLPEAGLFLAADVVTFYAGNQLMFSRSGRVVPAVFNLDRWLVLNLDGVERAYTRLAVDPATGAEVWFRAEWANGEIQRVVSDAVVKLVGPVGFGTEAQAARMWESSLFTATRQPTFFHLYKDGGGERVIKDLDAGTESRLPLDWRFAGADIVQTRSIAGGGRRERLWVPLRNRGASVRFVMESEVLRFDDGRPDQILIQPRVNHYLDRGEAVRPQGLAAAKSLPQPGGEADAGTQPLPQAKGQLRAAVRGTSAP